MASALASQLVNLFGLAWSNAVKKIASACWEFSSTPLLQMLVVELLPLACHHLTYRLPFRLQAVRGIILLMEKGQLLRTLACADAVSTPVSSR